MSDRFSPGWSDADLRERIAVAPMRLSGLDDLAADIAVARIVQALKVIVTPTEQMLHALRRLMHVAHAYCERAYGDPASMLRLVYGAAAVSADEGQAICVTGPAGVGKSVLLDVFCRLFDQSCSLVIPHQTTLEIHACWRLKIQDRVGFPGLVQPQFRHPDAKCARIFPWAVREAAAQGIALILADEFQFITGGSDANTLMSKLLLRLSQVGPPLIYACNYSMVHALRRRPQQERDRLLLDPILILPEPLGSDWEATVMDALGVADAFENLGAPATIELLHRYTFGIKRALRNLLGLAYAQMRNAGAERVDADHLGAAYLSLAFDSMRADTETLTQGVLAPAGLPSDLRCPFAHTAPLSPPAPGASITPHPAVEEHEANLAQAALRSQLSPQAQKLLDRLESQSTVPDDPKGKSARRPAPTADNLVGGAQRFMRGHPPKS